MAEQQKTDKRLINDVFTGALIRLGAIYTSSNNTLLWNDFKAKTFDNYGAVVIAIVGKAPSNEWNAADPEGIRNASGCDNWRMFTTHARLFIQDNSHLITLYHPKLILHLRLL